MTKILNFQNQYFLNMIIFRLLCFFGGCHRANLYIVVVCLLFMCYSFLLFQFFSITDERLLGLEEYMSNSIKEENVLRLLIAAALVEEIRFAIYEQTSFRCSAGISHNKVSCNQSEDFISFLDSM